jgi:hypothetical protein
VSADYDKSKPGISLPCTDPKKRLVYEPPENEEIEQEIVNLAEGHADWNQDDIYNQLVALGYPVTQAVVNFVLACHKLPNLRKCE